MNMSSPILANVELMSNSISLSIFFEETSFPGGKPALLGWQEEVFF
jgi:hypothetical protein